MTGAAFGRPTRFFKGNLHTHTTRSDGVAPPGDVSAAYAEAGYDFLVLSDHLESEYGWRVTDTDEADDPRLVLIRGAELSTAPWDDRDVMWFLAVGLPRDFRTSGEEDPLSRLQRARDHGAYLVLLHPGLNGLDPTLVRQSPLCAFVDAVEIYNHNLATLAPDAAHAEYMLDALLDAEAPVHVNVGDDAHWSHPHDRFGAWLEVAAPHQNGPSILEALRVGAFFASQGPAIATLERRGDDLIVETSPVRAISLCGPTRQWREVQSAIGPEVVAASFDLSPFRGTHCRIIAIDPAGRRAWSNPIWP